MHFKIKAGAEKGLTGLKDLLYLQRTWVPFPETSSGVHKSL